jgi:hypothetical protein
MLTRVYIDNFLCFSNFELELGPRQLIFGVSGTGKSSLLRTLLVLKNFLIHGFSLDQQFPLHSVTKSSKSMTQTFELGCRVAGEDIIYRLEIDQGSFPSRTVVRSEKLHVSGRLAFEFVAPDVRVFGAQDTPLSSYKFDPTRSALQNVLAVGAGGPEVSQFGEWLRSLDCFKIQPDGMPSFTDREHPFPLPNLSNFASWYRYLALADREADAAFTADLREILDGFRLLDFRQQGEQKQLEASFSDRDDLAVKFSLQDLSDGQRCIIGLYAILHFALRKGHTVVIDEPDNFIALREIQPWLLSVEDAVDSGCGQALIISHHPEVINQWAVDCGIRFYREKVGPVRTQRFSEAEKLGLPAAELIARGWEA